MYLNIIYIYILMTNIPLCFDKFVISKKNLIALNKDTTWSSIPSCENYRKTPSNFNSWDRMPKGLNLLGQLVEMDEMLGGSDYEKFNIRNHCIN
jgi:hypothetical protein